MSDKVCEIGDQIYASEDGAFKINIFKTIDKETQEKKLQIFISTDNIDDIWDNVLHIKTDQYTVLNLPCIPSECYYVYMSEFFRCKNKAKHTGIEVAYSKRVNTINKTSNEDVGIVSASMVSILDHTRKIIPSPKEVIDIKSWLK